MLNRNLAEHQEICHSAKSKLVELNYVSAQRDLPFLTPSQILLPLLTFPLYFTNIKADKMEKEDESHVVFLSDMEEKKAEH